MNSRNIHFSCLHSQLSIHFYFFLCFQLTACPETFVDVEAAQWQSESCNVLVYSSLQTAHNLLYAHIRMPIHLRYHAPTETGGYAGVYIPPPKLLIRCSNEITCGNKDSYFVAPCAGCTGSSCSWLQLQFNTVCSDPFSDFFHCKRMLEYGFTYFLCLFLFFRILLNKA